ncbi:hypothetical protein F3Y22_tig00110247pilonHSYRG00046 [Hibiscus syriacus]|uniref:Serine-threonine/tyrosine-protein kinase catalytic domain-containing protein n=1 Tax=Hibiscus syriacus TaxID=106335 RepID=A0A6A3BCL0_HIBSY|nr:hypothetical protein F3Y22_tig00110247pilonHSYRG00046 [Hibiscus syriacus]
MRSLKKVWLNENNFTGKIPSSLMQLPNLVELHLEGNHFSGVIPELMYPNVTNSLNLSSNNLDGNIPKSFSKFNASAFEGNVGLCGTQLKRRCVHHSIADKSTSPSTASIIVISVTLAAMFFFVIATIASNTQDEGDDSSDRNSSRGSSRHVHVTPGSARQTLQESSGKNSLSLKIKRGLSPRAEMGNGLVVVVKRMREMTKLGKDGFGEEMKRFGEFEHPNVLTPLAFHYRKEDKLIVSEYMPCGSLSYALHGNIIFIFGSLSYILNMFYLINSNDVAKGLFAYRSPECLQNQHVSPKSDFYCLGIVILEIVTGKYPSLYLNKVDGGIDIVQWVQSSMSEKHVGELIDPGILSSGPASITQMVKIIEIGVACTKSNERLNLNNAISEIQEVSSSAPLGVGVKVFAPPDRKDSIWDRQGSDMDY